MTTRPVILYAGREIPERNAPNIFAFVAWMSARVAAQRGGKTSTYLRECFDFQAEVVGKRLSVSDPLPDDFDWRPSAAIECAEAMLEYDA